MIDPPGDSPETRIVDFRGRDAPGPVLVPGSAETVLRRHLAAASASGLGEPLRVLKPGLAPEFTWNLD